MTPSEFTSPLKLESDLHKVIPSHPLLSPASIRASALLDQPTVTDDTAISNQTISLPLDASDQVSLPLSLSDTQGTLTSVTANVQEPAVMPSALDDQDATAVHENSEEKVDVPVESEFGELGKNVRITDDPPLPPPPEMVTDDDDDQVPSLEDTQKAFNGIMEFLSIDKPEAASQQPIAVSFDEFAELLHNPGKLQEKERGLEMAEEPALAPQIEDSPAEVIGATSASSFPDVLKSASYQDLPLASTEVDDSGKSESGKISGEMQWPDIGAPKPAGEFAEKLQTDKCDLAEACIVSGVVSNEVCQADSQSSEERLLMPSALTDLQELQMLGSKMEMEVTESKKEVEAVSSKKEVEVVSSKMETEIADISLDLLDQELSAENKWILDMEEGPMKSKSRSRKRSKKGKKMNASPPMSMGVTEALRYLYFWLDNVYSRRPHLQRLETACLLITHRRMT